MVFIAFTALGLSLGIVQPAHHGIQLPFLGLLFLPGPLLGLPAFPFHAFCLLALPAFRLLALPGRFFHPAFGLLLLLHTDGFFRILRKHLFHGLLGRGRFLLHGFGRFFGRNLLRGLLHHLLLLLPGADGFGGLYLPHAVLHGAKVHRDPAFGRGLQVGQADIEKQEDKHT